MNNGWKPAHIGIQDDSAVVGGLRVWKHDWKRIQEQPIMLKHLTHLSEEHPFWIYEMSDGGKTVRFAATELSAGVWGFYEAA